MVAIAGRKFMWRPVWGKKMGENSVFGAQEVKKSAHCDTQELLSHLKTVQDCNRRDGPR